MPIRIIRATQHELSTASFPDRGLPEPACHKAQEAFMPIKTQLHHRRSTGTDQVIAT